MWGFLGQPKIGLGECLGGNVMRYFMDAMPRQLVFVGVSGLVGVTFGGCSFWLNYVENVFWFKSHPGRRRRRRRTKVLWNYETTGYCSHLDHFMSKSVVPKALFYFLSFSPWLKMKLKEIFREMFRNCIKYRHPDTFPSSASPH